LLEPVSGYDRAFRDLVMQTTGMPDEQGAMLEAVRQVTAGLDET
jgi:hypothetical protein